VEGTLALPLEEGVSLQMADVVDVGHASAVGEGDPERFVGEGYDLASRRADARPRPRRSSHRSGVDVDPYQVIERA
jgi:hypothetical protein